MTARANGTLAFPPYVDQRKAKIATAYGVK
jgi:hypothetical protein